MCVRCGKEDFVRKGGFHKQASGGSGGGPDTGGIGFPGPPGAFPGGMPGPFYGRGGFGKRW